MIINVKYVMSYLVLFIYYLFFLCNPGLSAAVGYHGTFYMMHVGKTAYRYSPLVGGGALRGWLQDGRLRALPKPVIAGV